jgi:20S proteasome subunit alpha 5
MEEKLDAKNVQLASVTKEKGFRIYNDEEMGRAVELAQLGANQ